MQKQKWQNYNTKEYFSTIKGFGKNVKPFYRQYN